MYKDQKVISNLDNNHQIISNEIDKTMFKEISYSLKECESFIFNVAFINFGGVQLLVNALDEARTRGISGKILTSDYLDFTEPKALRKLNEFENIETRIFLEANNGPLHSKSYIFKYKDYIKVYIGSSNITESALLRNIEWNVLIITKEDDEFYTEILRLFNNLWQLTTETDERFLSEYENFYEEIIKFKEREKFAFKELTVKPNKMQEQALINLHSLRTRGIKKGLVIAATATGKTYMAAFDVKQFRARKVLFLVHREDILVKAESSFKTVLGSKIDTGLFTGTTKELEHQYVFATIQSFKNIVETLNPKTFDYVIIDESHHATAETYTKIIDHLKPDFLLGMTATPERTDGMGLFALFDNNVALEIRLHDALESDLICSFHYFGVKEVDGLDLSDLKENEIDKLSKRLSTYARTDYIIEKMNLYGHDGNKLKCLAFCASVEHAQFMSKSFNEKGIPSIDLTGKDKPSEREKAVKSLESNDPTSLNIIFTVDVFNEGIDIPSINLVLMLRPTSSPIIFVQQIGRGLRKLPEKKFVTILDFIGNYTKNFMASFALKGNRIYDKESITLAIENDFPELPGNSFVIIDEISKETILKQISAENFESLKYLKDIYYQFRNQFGRTPVTKLMSYEIYDNAPDPLSFLNQARTYPEFINRIGDSPDEIDTFIKSDEYKYYRFINYFLPLKRPLEFYILSLLFEKNHYSYYDLFIKLQSLVNNLDETSFKHACNVLAGTYLDSLQLRSFEPIISFNNESVSLINKFIEHYTVYNSIYSDVIKYGLTRYQREFTNITYKVPFFKLYETYKMTDAALLSNVEKKFSCYRGQGVYKNNNDYFLFIELEKDENIKESIKYHDNILSIDRLQWASQNGTAINSINGQNLINHIERNIHLHIFIRKFKKVDGNVQPYIYIGKANYISHTGEKPIHFILQLENPLPKNLYKELTSDSNIKLS